jgi:hypothetical protein
MGGIFVDYEMSMEEDNENETFRRLRKWTFSDTYFWMIKRLEEKGNVGVSSELYEITGWTVEEYIDALEKNK